MNRQEKKFKEKIFNIFKICNFLKKFDIVKYLCSFGCFVCHNYCFRRVLEPLFLSHCFTAGVFLAVDFLAASGFGPLVVVFNENFSEPLYVPTPM